MSESCNHDCSNCSQNCGNRDPKSFLKPQNEKSDIKKVIGVTSGKGGVGKSMVTSLLAIALRRKGYKVGILDADITGPSIPKTFGVNKAMVYGDDTGIEPVESKSGIKVMSLNLLMENETDPVAWRGPILAGMVTQFWTDVRWGDIDYLLVDMPPGTGDVTLTVYQSIPLSGLVVVSTPQDLVQMIVEKSIKMADMMKLPVVGLAENMSYIECPDCGKKISVFGESKVEEVAKQFKVEHYSRLPIRPELTTAVDNGILEDVEITELDELIKAVEDCEIREI